ncbi:MAG: prenyltransferase/squalene oxidase repeat-containing protein, partial [Lentisphaerota bacterium]
MNIKSLMTSVICNAITVFVIFLSGAELRAAGDSFLFDAYVKLDVEAETAVKKAQAWLAETQRSDGAWHSSYGINTGVAAFATMALMVNGSVPGEGPYGKEVGKGLQFLLNSQKESGLIVADPKSNAPMYQHALATIALAEMYGMTENPRIRSSLINAVNLIVDVQDNGGGWRYQPIPSPGDISATVMQVMALRAASDAGIYVPEETVTRAIKFVRKCYNVKEKG